MLNLSVKKEPDLPDLQNQRNITLPIILSIQKTRERTTDMVKKCLTGDFQAELPRLHFEYEFRVNEDWETIIWEASNVGWMKERCRIPSEFRKFYGTIIEPWPYKHGWRKISKYGRGSIWHLRSGHIMDVSLPYYARFSREYAAGPYYEYHCQVAERIAEELRKYERGEEHQEEITENDIESILNGPTDEEAACWKYEAVHPIWF